MFSPFKSDLINNMDHMRISGTGPSSVILSQTKSFKKLISDAQKYLNKLKPKGMIRLGYCFTLYQRLWLYNGTHLVAFYDTLLSPWGRRGFKSRIRPPYPSVS